MIENWGVLEHYPTRILSYKKHVRDGEMDPMEATIVYFHGNPKQSDLPEHDPVRRRWEQQ